MCLNIVLLATTWLNSQGNVQDASASVPFAMACQLQALHRQRLSKLVVALECAHAGAAWFMIRCMCTTGSTPLLQETSWVASWIIMHRGIACTGINDLRPSKCTWTGQKQDIHHSSDGAPTFGQLCACMYGNQETCGTTLAALHKAGHV